MDIFRQPEPLWYYPDQAIIKVPALPNKRGFRYWRGSFRVWLRP